MSIQNIKQVSKSLGVELHPAVAEAERKAQSVHAGVRDMTVEAPDLLASVFDCLEAGRDWTKDRTVLAATTAHILGSTNLGAAAQVRAQKLTDQAVVEHADEIITSWDEALAPHAEALVRAADQLPVNVTLDEGHAQAAAGVGLAGTWGDARAALTLWSTAIGGWRTLARMSGVRIPSNRAGHIVYADTTDPTILAEINSHTRANPYTAALAGAPLRLATLSSYMRACAEYQAREQAEAEAAPGADYRERNRETMRTLYVGLNA